MEESAFANRVQFQFFTIAVTNLLGADAEYIDQIKIIKEFKRLEQEYSSGNISSVALKRLISYHIQRSILMIIDAGLFSFFESLLPKSSKYLDNFRNNILADGLSCRKTIITLSENCRDASETNSVVTLPNIAPFGKKHKTFDIKKNQPNRTNINSITSNSSNFALEKRKDQKKRKYTNEISESVIVPKKRTRNRNMSNISLSREFEVENILLHTGSSSNKRLLKFLIRWKGYSATEDSWLTYDECRDLKALDKYCKLHKDLQNL